MNFEIKMSDGVSAPAQKAASSLYQLDAAIKNEGAALQMLRSQMALLATSGDKTSDKFKALSNAASVQRTKIGQLKDQLLDAGGLPKAAGAAKGFEAALKKVESALDPLIGKTGKLGSALAALGPEGAIAAAAVGGVLALAGAVGYLAYKLADLGIQASEAKGDVTRSLEVLYGGEKAAEHTYKVLESLTGDIAISQDRVMELADHLIKAGQVNGDAMVKSIAAIGKAEAARKGAGQVIEGVITRSQQARMFSISRSELMQVGLSYKDLAKAISKGTGMAVGDAELRLRTGGVSLKAGLNALTGVIDSKLGDIANKKLMTVGAQTQRLRDAFGRLFESADASGFARVLNIIANQLSESSVAGDALRTLLKNAFDSMSAAAEAAIPYVQTLFEGAILLALDLYNATYPIRKALKDMFGRSPAVSDFEDGMLTVIGTVNKLAIGLGAIAGYTPLWYVMAAAVGVLLAPLAIVTGALFGIGYGFAYIVDKGIQFLGWLVSLPGKALQVGKDLISGIVNGIVSGAGAVGEAIHNMATKALQKFKDVFGIKSPSKVMQLQGQYINMGLAKGVNDNADAPVAAVSNMAKDVAEQGPGAPGGAQPQLKGARSGGGAGITINIHEGAIVVSGSNGQEIATSLRDPLTELFADTLERAAAMVGALEVKGAA